MRQDSFDWENGVSRCPKCKSRMVEIVNSRPREKYFYRQRKCIVCNEKYATVEISLEAYEANEKEKAELKEIVSKVVNVSKMIGDLSNGQIENVEQRKCDSSVNFGHEFRTIDNNDNNRLGT